MLASKGERAVLDCVRERRPPFSPDSVVTEYAALLTSYGLARVVGDRYAGEWPRERFRAYGITYEPASRTKSELYAALLPAVNSDRVELLEHPRLAAQLLALERRVARGGRDSVDHPPGGHDDLANAVAGALVEAAGSRTNYGVLSARFAELNDALWRPNPWRLDGETDTHA